MLILKKFFLKYGGGVSNSPLPLPPGKATLKQPDLIKVNDKFYGMLNLKNSFWNLEFIKLYRIQFFFYINIYI